MPSFVENPNKLEQYGAYQKAIDSNEDFSNLEDVPLSKKEIRLRTSIKKVLLALDNHKKLNVSGILDKSGIHTNTLYHVMPILLKRKIISEKRIRHINNQKFYSLKRNRAIVYLEFLFLTDRFNIFNDLHKNLKQHFEKYCDPYPSLDIRVQKQIASFVEQRFTLTDELMKDCIIKKRSMSISDLTVEPANKLIMYFLSHKLCMGKCFENNHLSKVIVKDGISYCAECGHETKEDVYYSNPKLLHFSKGRFDKDSIPE
ncbi:hypothetical protein [Candidatus Nitrosarchaeum limnium]|jgi:hypothetical protein|uniref:Uncharacterized protein n=1 Tax=Candidatus Nitrosarchaeum limnium BG20 TaxID=859192 RepID=S2E0H6_9ARCH|nr:hypothetical protein [Candidatus Nitrosarchaeum limnium]EPA04428.1 hypothetical protein BG20_I1832 [Candidatus Nitrosarchaeum limnium BG20]